MGPGEKAGDVTVKIRYSESPHVSVVIPAYNQARYLGEAIESVLAQSYRDFEIIVVDDGSTDETPAVAQQFGSSVHYIRQDNQGLAGARNTGIRQARGQLVALLDSDDIWSPVFLQTMTLLATQHPKATLYYCGWQYVNASGGALPQPPKQKIVPPDLAYWTLLSSNFLVSSVLLRRTAAVEAGLFDQSFRRLEDWEFWLRLVRRGHIFIGCTECLFRYRLHGTSLSTNSQAMRQTALTVVHKHFGSEDGQCSDWSAEKRRAYGGAYRYHTITSVLHDNDWPTATSYLRKAIQYDPTLAVDVDLFFELALGSQPPGYRGTHFHLDLEKNAGHIGRALARIFSSPLPSEVALLRNSSFATAYFALGLAFYNVGQLTSSWRFLAKALRFRPSLWRNRRLCSTLLKSLFGQSCLTWLRHLRHARHDATGQPILRNKT